MQILFVLLVAGATFFLCYLVDKGFTRLFRSQAQHFSGLSVRLNKHYGGMGLVLAVVGIGAVFTGLNEGAVLIAGGCVLIAVGVGLVVYYMSFGIFYDDDGFVLTTFAKKSRTYRYADIISQQLYNNGGTTLIELHLADGQVAHLQPAMTGAYAFLDHAFARWLAQKGLTQEQCPFYDPDNSCWFPQAEV